MSLKTADLKSAGGHGETHAHQRLNMQYENIDQQNECYMVGMWSFLVTEVMFFGALFLVYALYRTMYFETYLDATKYMNVVMGGGNTVVLLISSLSMVLAVDAAQKAQPKRVIKNLGITILCACIFLVVKGFEYKDKFDERLFPSRAITGKDFDYAYATQARFHHEVSTEDPTGRGEYKDKPHPTEVEDGKPAIIADTNPVVGFNSSVAAAKPGEFYVARSSGEALRARRFNDHARIFFSIYFSMTGLHAVHVIIGIILLGYLIHLYAMKRKCVDDYLTIEMIGMYWHFVDIVWIFLFPMMYLIA
jgi:cytochrome c oxidase subunit III